MGSQMLVEAVSCPCLVTENWNTSPCKALKTCATRALLQAAWLEVSRHPCSPSTTSFHDILQEPQPGHGVFSCLLMPPFCCGHRPFPTEGTFALMLLLEIGTTRCYNTSSSHIYDLGVAPTTSQTRAKPQMQ